MNSSGFDWVVSPQVIADGLEDYRMRALVAIHVAASKWGQSIQDKARDKKAWEDRTGNARGGLFFAVDGFGFNPMYGEVKPEAKSDMSDTTVESGDANTLIVTLGHTVYYGKFLELSNGGRHAVVMSTMEENLPELEQELRLYFEG